MDGWERLGNQRCHGLGAWAGGHGSWLAGMTVRGAGLGWGESKRHEPVGVSLGRVWSGGSTEGKECPPLSEPAGHGGRCSASTDGELLIQQGQGWDGKHLNGTKDSPVLHPLSDIRHSTGTALTVASYGRGTAASWARAPRGSEQGLGLPSCPGLRQALGEVMVGTCCTPLSHPACGPPESMPWPRGMYSQGWEDIMAPQGIP